MDGTSGQVRTGARSAVDLARQLHEERLLTSRLAAENIRLLDALDLAYAKVVELGGTPDYGRLAYMRYVDRLTEKLHGD